MENYILWTHHGERGVVLEDDEEDDYDDNYIPADWVEGKEFLDVAMGEGGEDCEDESLDDFGQVLEDARQGTQNAKVKKKFENMLEDHK
jgi:hypothetical protein